MRNPKELIGLVRKSMSQQVKNWVLFLNGAYIILDDAVGFGKKEQAIEIMKEYGPVNPGSPSGDTSVINLRDMEGWIVGCDYSNMCIYVHPVELKEAGVDNPSDLDIGIFGRAKRVNILRS